jgi:dipeptidyl aminopeptidase/acylaminoacyl peptidase
MPDGSESTLISPKIVDAKSPLIVILDGKPHLSANFDEFNKEVLILLNSGYNLLFCQYKGTDGSHFTQWDRGHEDVKIVEKMTRNCIENSTFIDREKVGLIGKGYGSFLAAYLVGEFKDLFNCAFIQEPWVNEKFTHISDNQLSHAYLRPPPSVISDVKTSLFLSI